MQFHLFLPWQRLMMLFALAVAGFTRNSAAQDLINDVWWEAVAVSPGALVIEQGQGLVLDLVCDVASQDGDPIFVWDVTMRVRNEDQLYGWATDLKTVPQSVSAVSYEYLEPLYSPGGAFQAYVPFNYVLPSTAIGSSRDLTTMASAYTFSPAPDYTHAHDGAAWSLFRFRLTKTLTDYDSGFDELYGETGPIEWADEFGWGVWAYVANNDLMDISQAGTRYPGAVITIEGPQGSLWTPDMIEPLYPDDAPPPDDDDPPIDDDPTDPPDDTPDPDDDDPVDEGPSDDDGPPASDADADDSSDDSASNDSSNIYLYVPPLLPIAPEFTIESLSAPNAPSPLDSAAALTPACGAQSLVSMCLLLAGVIGLSAGKPSRSR
ncbi:MAG TPA: hypothetical protein VNT79_19055 [Phycisphaerae bacterium]|nr:hypothetical protein [Phycisphaerae bacterium]